MLATAGSAVGSASGSISAESVSDYVLGSVSTGSATTLSLELIS